MSQNKTSEVWLVGLTGQLYSSHISFSVRGNDVKLFFISGFSLCSWQHRVGHWPLFVLPDFPFRALCTADTMRITLRSIGHKAFMERKERSGDLCNYVEGECVHVFVWLVNRACLWLSCMYVWCVCVCVCVCVCACVCASVYWIGVRVGRDAQTDCWETDVHLSEQLELTKLKGLHIVSTRHRGFADFCIWVSDVFLVLLLEKKYYMPYFKLYFFLNVTKVFSYF